METTTIVLSTTPHGDDDDCSIDYTAWRRRRFFYRLHRMETTMI
uniref:Uncharacterized protein n=1 Tax=Cucumis melo TaxID=3656 RepID=A0A9I9E409_CUCME